MTIGPAPMIITVLISVRLGMVSSVKSFPPRAGREPGNLLGRPCIDRAILHGSKHGLLHCIPAFGRRAYARAELVVVRIHRTGGVAPPALLHHRRYPVHATRRQGVGNDRAGKRVAVGIRRAVATARQAGLEPLRVRRRHDESRVRAKQHRNDGHPDNGWPAPEALAGRLGGNGLHFACIDATKRSNNGPTSCGPGLASGWPWKLKAGASVSSMPWLLPSNNERCVTRTLAGNVDSSTAKPWFWLVMRTRPLSRSITGWFAPWCPNFILSVRAPAARPSSW